MRPVFHAIIVPWVIAPPASLGLLISYSIFTKDSRHTRLVRAKNVVQYLQESLILLLVRGKKKYLEITKHSQILLLIRGKINKKGRLYDRKPDGKEYLRISYITFPAKTW